MASERSPLVDYAIIGLLVVNVGLTAFSVFGTHHNRNEFAKSAESAGSGEAKLEVSDTEAVALANGVVALYNAKDSVGLYEKFDALAKSSFHNP
jgi:hypothetical protein